MSYKFDGTNSTCNFGDLASVDFGTGNFTVAFWSNNTALDKNIITKDNFAGDGNGIYIASSSPNTAWDYWDGSSDNYFGTADGTWRFVTCVRTGTGANQVICYENAIQMITATDGRTLSNALTLRFGSSSDMFASYLYTKDLAFVQIFNRDLTVGEISQIMRFPGSITRGLVLFCPLWATATATDYSGNGSDGTNTSITLSTTDPPVNGVMTIPDDLGFLYSSLVSSTATAKPRPMMLMGVQ